MILAAVQYKPRLASCPADVHDNIRRAEPLFHQAYKAAAEFIVMPELCFTGYSFMNKDEAARVCESPTGQTMRTMRGIAQELKAYLVWGYVRAERDNLYNSAVLIDPGGKILTSYDKVNLWGNDFLWARPGEDSAPIVKTEFGETSIVVCRDLIDKIPNNIPRVSAVNGPPLFKKERVDLVAAMVNWGKGGYPATSWMNFASNNKCTLIVSNRYGEEVNEQSKGAFKNDFGQGGSIIVEKDWKVHTGGVAFNQDCIVIGSI